MTAPVNPDVATVRTLAGVNGTDWPDTSVQALLDAENGVVKLATADLLEILAGQLTDVETDEVKLTGATQAKTLMARAAALRTQHYELDGGDFAFEAASMQPCGTETFLDRWFAEDGVI